MSERSAWLGQAGWGLMLHYLGTPDLDAEAWSCRVDGFDVAGLAAQLATLKAGYLIFTVGQNSGHYCAPNAAYDGYVGRQPSWCSRRDLIADLGSALAARDIRLIVYVPSGAPAADALAVMGLEWEWGRARPWPDDQSPRTGKRLEAFQRKWESVLREWSVRWGSTVAGWWVDGVYFADAMYRHADAPNFASLAAALRAGNPEASLAFGTGPIPWMQACLTQTDAAEDFTNGECNELFPVAVAAATGKARTHVLGYLGEDWGRGEPRFTTEFVAGYTHELRQRGAAVTWDVPPSPDGTLPPEFARQLARLSQG